MRRYHAHPANEEESLAHAALSMALFVVLMAGIAAMLFLVAQP